MLFVFVFRIFSRAILLIPLFGFQAVRSNAKTRQEAHESDATKDAPG
jgi:hypothetical protein